MDQYVRQPIDREWLESVNADRRKEQLDKVSYEVFEIVMDRLEKEWFDLVCPLPYPSHARYLTGPIDEEYPEA